MTKWMACVASLALALLSAWTSQERAEEQRPRSTVAAPQNDKEWRRLHEQFLARARRGGVELLFLGDSITFGWRGQPAWKRDFEPLGAANFGIGGDQTQHVLWRVENGELEGIDPKVVVLMIGTNNLGRDSAEETALGVQALVEEIMRRKPDARILLLGVFPRGHKPTDSVRTKVRTLNRLISPLDDGGKHVRYLNVGERFLEPDGTISKAIMPDYVHLTREGYDRWAAAIGPALRELMCR